MVKILVEGLTDKIRKLVSILTNHWYTNGALQMKIDSDTADFAFLTGQL